MAATKTATEVPRQPTKIIGNPTQNQNLYFLGNNIIKLCLQTAITAIEKKMRENLSSYGEPESRQCPNRQSRRRHCGPARTKRAGDSAQRVKQRDAVEG